MPLPQIRIASLGLVVLGPFACGGPLSAEPTPAPPSPTAQVHDATPIVRDLVWSGIDYDARRVPKERFLGPVRHCWEEVAASSPHSAGIARFDLQIDHEGYVVEREIHVLLFRDHFLGDADAEAEAAFASCAFGQFNRLPVPPATAATGSLSFDVRLLPAVGRDHAVAHAAP